MKFQICVTDYAITIQFKSQISIPHYVIYNIVFKFLIE